MSQIQSLLEDAGQGWKSMQGDAARLASKWNKTGLLEGLASEQDKNNMSLILENQAKQLVTEVSANPGGGANNGAGAFAVGTGAEWAGIALPLVRKVFGQIAAKEFVSVQPMNLPSGLVFYLDFQYGDNKPSFQTGESLYGTSNAGTYPFSTPATNLQLNNASGSIAGAQGLYGAGKFAYSTNQFSQSVGTTALPVVSGSLASSGIAKATWAEVNYDGRMSQSISNGEVWRVSLSQSVIAGGAAQVADLDLESVRAFVAFSASAAGVVAGRTTSSLSAGGLLPAFTKAETRNVVAATGLGTAFVSFFYTASGNTADVAQDGGAGGAVSSSTFNVLYNKRTTMSPYQIGDFEAGNTYAVPNALNATEIDIPEINIQMRSDSIVAKTKKLKAVWTPEFAQDLNAYQALDAEAEVTNIMSEYISLEIDLEILDMLIQDAAAGTEYWTAANNGVYNASANGFAFPTATSQTGFYNTQGQWFQTLGTKMQKLSNKIHQLTLRGGANFLVCSPVVATIIESIPGFASNSDGDASKMEYAFGVQKAGTMNSRYTVYKNPYMNENTILMGFRGGQFLEAGAVFAPYIPLIMTPLIYDPTTFTPRKGLLTRYAKKMIRPEFYGKIFVSGLESL